MDRWSETDFQCEFPAGIDSCH